MIVMKFGGTSLGSAARIRKVLEIVRGHLAHRPVLVVSAHAGVTDALIELADRAASGDPDTSAIEERHEEILAELGLANDLLDPLLRELADLARGMALVGEASPRARDYLLSFGERCSARVVAAFFTAQGLPARALDAFDIGLRTDSSFGRAKPLPDDGRIARALAAIAEIPVVTGFIAKDERGNVTTLGRNGSDLSASLLGHALNAEEIQIWTDVDGVMTADPQLVPAARPIRRMSFDEASELAYYGGRVLHPATLVPAMQKGIPVRVLDTSRPDSPGTRILAELDEPAATIRAIVHKRGIHLVNLVSPRMLQQHGFLARVFAAAARHEVDVDVVATSEVSITMSTDSAHGLEGLREDLSAIGEVTVEPNHALLCVVGRGIAERVDVPGIVFGTLARAGVRVRVISQGAIKVNLAMILAEQELERAIRALHAELFEREEREVRP